jgi:hypothetical protein
MQKDDNNNIEDSNDNARRAAMSTYVEVVDVPPHSPLLVDLYNEKSVL